MKFQDLYEKENKEHSAVSPGVQTLPVDQFMGAYKFSKEVAGHDGKKQHSPDVSGSKAYTDKPIVVGYTDVEDRMTKAVLPKTTQTAGSGSEEPSTVQKNSPLSKKSVKEAYQNDEANVFYKYDTADGKLKQRMVQNLDEPRARSAGYKETQEQALKAAGIMRSKFDPKKFVQNQNGKWVTVYPYGQQGVAEGLGKDIKRLATGKDVKSRAGQEIAKSQDASMKGDTKTSKKHFDRYDKLDKLANKEQGVAEGSGGNWYIRVNGKILNDTKFKPVIFSSENEARSHAMKLADKKRIPLSQMKLTKSWMDAPEQGVAEGSEQQFMIYFVVPEHDDYPDRKEPTERTIVVANSLKDAVIKFKAETPEAYIKDVVAMKQGVAEGEKDTSWMNKQSQDFYNKSPHFKRDDREVKSLGNNRLATKVSPMGGVPKVSKKPITSFNSESTVDKYSQQGVAEAKSLAKKVKVVKGEHAGKTGWIREIKHGAFKGAPKTYYIDLDDGGQANNLPSTALRLVKAVDEGLSADIRDYFANPKNDIAEPYRRKSATPPQDIQMIMWRIKQRQPVSKSDQQRLANWAQQAQKVRTVYADVNESDMGEGVIYQLDKENPMSGTEVLVIGGAGRYSLDGLRAKARKEVAELAKDLEIEHGGAFRRSAHNVKQLQNTLNTIVAAYDELNQIRKLGGMRSKGIKDEDATVVREGLEVMEKWTQKYKNSINCSDPKGFSQRAHCAGKKK